jgi:hypothetical protein
MDKEEMFALGVLVGVIVGVSLGLMLSQVLARPASVVFDRDSSGRITAIHYAQVR